MPSPVDPPVTIVRRAARILVLDSGDRILLLCARDPGDGRLLWLTPGGGCEPGESLEETARRELREEVGVSSAELGALVWRRDATTAWNGKPYRAIESFFLCRVDAIEPTVEGMDEAEARVFVEHRWWTVDEIDAAGDDVTFAPRRLGQFLRALLQDGPSEKPVDVGL
jgi:8-oxo-dGTP pyrophosphatase MutT (NUDIX family)